MQPEFSLPFTDLSEYVCVSQAFAKPALVQ